MQFPYSIISLFCLLFVGVSCFYHKNSVCILKETDDCRIIPDWEENSAHNVSHEKRFIFFSFFWQKWRLSVHFSPKFDSHISGWNSDHILSGILGLQINRKISHPTNSRITRKLDSIKSISIYIAASYFWAKLKLLNCDVLQWWDIFLSNIF